MVRHEKVQCNRDVMSPKARRLTALRALAEVVGVLHQAADNGGLQPRAVAMVGRVAELLALRGYRQRVLTTFGQSLRFAAELFDILDHEAGVAEMGIVGGDGRVMTAEELFPHLSCLAR